MESKIQQFSAFQIYSTGTDHLWIHDKRVFFRVVKGIDPNEHYFRKEHGKNIYSIKKEDLVSIRCRLYF